MPDWLKNTWASGPTLPLEELFLRLMLAFGCGWLVAFIYRRSRHQYPVAPTFPTTLVLLAILIAGVTQVIGENVARAFSLVGALSIVRFRTVVQDTQDTAYVIFAVVTGMAVGAGHLEVALASLVVVGLAALVVRPRVANVVWAAEESHLTVRFLIGQKPDTLVAPVFGRHLEHHEITRVSTAKQGSVLDVSYRLRLRAGSEPSQLVSDLNQIEGIQSVELRRDEPVD